MKIDLTTDFADVIAEFGAKNLRFFLETFQRGVGLTEFEFKDVYAGTMPYILFTSALAQNCEFTFPMRRVLQGLVGNELSETSPHSIRTYVITEDGYDRLTFRRMEEPAFSQLCTKEQLYV